MATQAASPAAVLPSAQVVGNAFVEQYYHILHQSPELVHKFYQDSSILSRPDTNGLMSSVTTMQAIDEKIQSLDYKNYKAEIKTADAQDSHQAGVIVLVTGCLTGKDNIKKKFAQTFFLAPQEKGYFVQNDVFRYVDESAPLETTPAPIPDIIDSAPPAPALLNAANMTRSSASRDGDRRSRGSSSRGGNGDPAADHSHPATPFHDGSSGSIPDSFSPSDEYATPSHGRGSNTLAQPHINPSHRPMIYLHGAAFADHRVVRKIISILKDMFYGPWMTWKDVDHDSRNAMWERFNSLYQWDNSIDQLIKNAWTEVLKQRFPDILLDARDEAIARASQANIHVGDDFVVLKPFGPTWIDNENWAQLIDRVWNTPAWKNRSRAGRQNRNTLKDGQTLRHVDDSISISQHHCRMEEEYQRLVTGFEVFQRTHTRKESRSTGGSREGSSSGPQECVTNRAGNFATSYQEAMTGRYGSDNTQWPPIDTELWNQCGGSSKGKVYGFGSMSNPDIVLTGSPRTPSTGRSYVPPPSYSSNDEVQRMLEEQRIQMESRINTQVEAQVAAQMQQRDAEMDQRFQDFQNMLLARFPPPPPPE